MEITVVHSEDCCQWEAVECDASTTRVNRLFFHHKRDPSVLEHWYPNATLFAQFKELKELELPGNSIKGFTSPRDLSINQFSGSFPSSLIHNRTSIESLILSMNWFTDKVSFAIFANLSRLGQLDVSYNVYLELETESQTRFPSLNMYVLNLAGCSPRKFPSFLSTQNNLKSLDLSDNVLVGTIPSWVMHNTTSQLKVRDNSLSGPFPKIFRNRSSQLTSLDVSNNRFQGSFPRRYRLDFFRVG
ncbi:hypothetical protein V6N12_060455 [Hibiscus sabdariffa]|uniref:Leucine-rich repeat-containing N-terminal plant-type domain-containing protein n=1 Tax=Hibiscus sabdariffa TaxID=183260 RepID=A0ABR2D4F9_9ROSI